MHRYLQQRHSVLFYAVCCGCPAAQLGCLDMYLAKTQAGPTFQQGNRNCPPVTLLTLSILTLAKSRVFNPQINHNQVNLSLPPLPAEQGYQRRDFREIQLPSTVCLSPLY